MKFDTDRRSALFGLGTGLMLSGLRQNAAHAATGPTLEPSVPPTCSSYRGYWPACRGGAI
jgi:hypothetical protein